MREFGVAIWLVGGDEWLNERWRRCREDEEKRDGEKREEKEMGLLGDLYILDQETWPCLNPLILLSVLESFCFLLLLSRCLRISIPCPFIGFLTMLNTCGGIHREFSMGWLNTGLPINERFLSNGESGFQPGVESYGWLSKAFQMLNLPLRCVAIHCCENKAVAEWLRKPLLSQ